MPQSRSPSSQGREEGCDGGIRPVNVREDGRWPFAQIHRSRSADHVDVMTDADRQYGTCVVDASVVNIKVPCFSSASTGSIITASSRSARTAKLLTRTIVVAAAAQRLLRLL